MMSISVKLVIYNFVKLMSISVHDVNFSKTDYIQCYENVIFSKRVILLYNFVKMMSISAIDINNMMII